MTRMRYAQSLVRDNDCKEGYQQVCAQLDFAWSSASRVCYEGCLVPISLMMFLVVTEVPGLNPLSARY